MLTELEALEMAQEGRRAFKAHDFMRKVFAANPCHCGKPSVMMVSLRETGMTPAWLDDLDGGSRGNQPVPFTYYYPACLEHWHESRGHPHYHGAEEL